MTEQDMPVSKGTCTQSRPVRKLPFLSSLPCQPHFNTMQEFERNTRQGIEDSSGEEENEVNINASVDKILQASRKMLKKTVMRM
jgi:hypothetical protein